MIPLILQKSLADKCREIFDVALFKNQKNELVHLNVFEQYLPKNNNQENYPYCIVKLQEGEQEDISEPGQTQVIFIFGMYDEEETMVGYKSVANALNRLINELQRNPSINQQFEMKLPIRWAIHDEDTYPYYFGAVETIWEMPNAIREDVEAFI